MRNYKKLQKALDFAELVAAEYQDEYEIIGAILLSLEEKERTKKEGKIQVECIADAEKMIELGDDIQTLRDEMDRNLRELGARNATLKNDQHTTNRRVDGCMNQTIKLEKKVDSKPPVHDDERCEYVSARLGNDIHIERQRIDKCAGRIAVLEGKVDSGIGRWDRVWERIADIEKKLGG